MRMHKNACTFCFHLTFQMEGYHLLSTYCQKFVPDWDVELCPPAISNHFENAELWKYLIQSQDKLRAKWQNTHIGPRHLPTFPFWDLIFDILRLVPGTMLGANTVACSAYRVLWPRHAWPFSFDLKILTWPLFHFFRISHYPRAQTANLVINMNKRMIPQIERPLLEIPIERSSRHHCKQWWSFLRRWCPFVYTVCIRDVTAWSIQALVIDCFLFHPTAEHLTMMLTVEKWAHISWRMFL